MKDKLGAPVPTIKGTGAPMVDLMTPELLALPDSELHQRLMAIRDAHQSYVDFLNKWMTTVRARSTAGRSEQSAADELKVSRAAVRKAVAKKAAPKKQ